MKNPQRRTIWRAMVIAAIFALAGSPLMTALAGGTTTIAAAGQVYSIGRTVAAPSGYMIAQSFQAYPGIASQFTITLLSSVGSPVGTLTWNLATDSSGQPGSILASGTFTPIPSSVNTISIPSGPSLSTTTTYWLVLFSTSVQSSGDHFWSWSASTTSTYALGACIYSSNAGSTWTDAGVDCDMSITTIDPPTDTPTPTPTSTATNTPTETYTPSATYTPSNTPTGTLTPSNTPTETLTPSNTPTETPTYTLTPSATPTIYTWTPTATANVEVVLTTVYGQQWKVKYEITAGDITISSLLLFGLIISGFTLFIVLVDHFRR